VYLVLLEELVGRHLRTNPLDKYGVLLAYNIMGRALDDSLLAAQGTPSVVQMTMFKHKILMETNY
jgi:hypothetical protein